jgi:hypothetical protein
MRMRDVCGLVPCDLCTLCVCRVLIWPLASLALAPVAA